MQRVLMLKLQLLGILCLLGYIGKAQIHDINLINVSYSGNIEHILSDNATTNDTLIDFDSEYSATGANQKSYIALQIDEASVINNQNLVSVDEGAVSTELATVYPNPFEQIFTVNIHNENITSLKLINLLDKQIKQFNVTDSSKLNINLKNSPNGVYIIKYFDKKQRLLGAQKIIKAQ